MFDLIPDCFVMLEKDTIMTNIRDTSTNKERATHKFAKESRSRPPS